MYVYVKSEEHLWTVGFFTPDKGWVSVSDHTTAEEAAARVHYLNGGGQDADLAQRIAALEQRVAAADERVDARLSEHETRIDLLADPHRW